MMKEDVTSDDVRQAIANVKHPAIDCSLIELGMVKDIIVEDNDAIFTLLLPFAGIPEKIKEYMINSLRQPIIGLGLSVDVKIETMNGEERKHFLTMEQNHWKGL